MIGKIESLIILVQSLSKAEKRYFRLQTNLQSGDKSYLSLYELLERGYPAEETETIFARQNPGKCLEMASKHLYKVLLDSLVRLREKEDIQTKIFSIITKADLLFERELFNEAFVQLDKAKRLATLYEKEFLQLLVRRIELHYLSTLEFKGISEKELVNKQMKFNEIMRNTRTSNLHLQLYDILKHRLNYKGYARSDKQKEDLNDLVLSELNLISNNTTKGFEVKKLHMLFQATYFLNSGNYKSALRYYKQLVELFESNRHLILNPPVYYLSAIQGILDSLQVAGLYDETPFFTGKLEEIEKGDFSIEYKLHIRALIFLYKYYSLINSGLFKETGRLIDEYENQLFHKINLLRLELQLKLHISLVTYYVYTGNLQTARKSMRKIVGSGKSFYMLPSYRITRLINLLLQVENGNYDFVYNEISTIRRHLRQEKQLYATERTVFKFLSFYPLPSYRDARFEIWEYLQHTIHEVNENKYEKQFLKMFDFIIWIEHKLTKQPIRELLIKKNNQEER